MITFQTAGFNKRLYPFYKAPTSVAFGRGDWQSTGFNKIGKIKYYFYQCFSWKSVWKCHTHIFDLYLYESLFCKVCRRYTSYYFKKCLHDIHSHNFSLCDGERENVLGRTKIRTTVISITERTMTVPCCVFIKLHTGIFYAIILVT